MQLRRLWLLAIAGILIAATLLVSAYGQHLSLWPEPVNLGAVNSSSADRCPFITKGGLTLYFASNRPGGQGGVDIYVSHRDSLEDPWETPTNLGSVINGTGDETSPELSVDGHRLYFASSTAYPGACGGLDLYVSRRANKHDDTGWESPQNLGCIVNSSSDDFNPSIFENDATGETVLYFSSKRSGGLGGNDIYASQTGLDGSLLAPLPVTELNTTFDDQQPSVRKDGLEIFFASNRTGSAGFDIWTSTRESISLPWSPSMNLGAPVNTASTEARPWLSFDGTALYLVSSRGGGVGGVDLWVTVRSKIKPKE